MKMQRFDGPDRTRRRLLSAALLLGSMPGSAWPGVGDARAVSPSILRPESARGRDVLILGAGMAGLVIAYELHRAGTKVRVIEARDRVGGRCWTLRGGDRFSELDGVEQTCGFAPELYLNPGANRNLTWHAGVLAYVQELGIPLELYTSGPLGQNWLLRDAPGHPLSGNGCAFASSTATRSAMPCSGWSSCWVTPPRPRLSGSAGGGRSAGRVVRAVPTR